MKIIFFLAKDIDKSHYLFKLDITHIFIINFEIEILK